jgi:hypothetical protein
MLKQLLTALTRIAFALETRNILASAQTKLDAEKNELSREVLAFQQQLLEQERARTIVHVEPDIKTLTKEVEQEMVRKVRRTGGVKAE